MLRADFKNKSLFSKTLEDRVSTFMSNNHQNEMYGIYKSLFIILSIVCVFLLLITGKFSFQINFLFLNILGFFLVLGGIHIMHEGTHGNISKSKNTNRIFCNIFEFIVCFSAKQYHMRHMIIHHTFTNMGEQDYDLNTNDTLRMSPFFKKKSLHKFQWLYFIFLYGIGILHIAWIEDIKRLFTSKVGNYRHQKWKSRDYILQLTSKSLHALVFIILPLQFFSIQNVFLSYFYVYIICGLGIALIFQVSHINTAIEYTNPKISNDDVMSVENDWFIHQLATTANYAPKSKFVLFFTGGVNLQVEHHLFPKISYFHLPAIREITMKTCREFDIEYREFPTYFLALKSHIRQLKTLGNE
jgi:linoleoyl-CoA desaturase